MESTKPQLDAELVGGILARVAARPLLLAAQMRLGRTKTGPVSPVSVMSGKLAERRTDAWAAVDLNRITLHECRHRYASFLMASGYKRKELMEFMAHADLEWSSATSSSFPSPSAQPGRAAQPLPGWRGRLT